MLYFYLVGGGVRHRWCGSPGVARAVPVPAAVASFSPLAWLGDAALNGLLRCPLAWWRSGVVRMLGVVAAQPLGGGVAW